MITALIDRNDSRLQCLFNVKLIKSSLKREKTTSSYDHVQTSELK